MKLDLAIQQVAASESELADELETIGERHRTEQDVFHMTEALAKLSRARIRKLAGDAERYGVTLDGEADGSERGGLLTAMREKTSELIGGRPEPGLLLLRDLRHVYLLASEASINWTILGQGAHAAKDAELLATVEECHAEELRALRWATTHIKETSPQVLTV